MRKPLRASLSIGSDINSEGIFASGRKRLIDWRPYGLTSKKERPLLKYIT